MSDKFLSRSLGVFSVFIICLVIWLKSPAFILSVLNGALVVLLVFVFLFAVLFLCLLNAVIVYILDKLLLRVNVVISRFSRFLIALAIAALIYFLVDLYFVDLFLQLLGWVGIPEDHFLTNTNPEVVGLILGVSIIISFIAPFVSGITSSNDIK